MPESLQSSASGNGPTSKCKEPASFDQVKSAEATEIRAARGRRERNATGAGPLNDASAVAFSGGGIRSATFNLGILQGLARYGYLSQIDYLSTVSGGGYIGSWLVAWIKRIGCREVEATLRENQQTSTDERWRYLEPDPVRWLRKYSNYLAPRAGLVSTDTWALLGVYLRNVLLNLLLLVVSGACLLMLPLMSLQWMKRGLVPEQWLLVGAVVLLLLACLSIAYSFATFSPDVTPEGGFRKWLAEHPGQSVAAPCMAAAICLMLAGVKASNRLGSTFTWVDAATIGAGAFLWLWTMGNVVASVINTNSLHSNVSLFDDLRQIVFDILTGTVGPEAVTESRASLITSNLFASIGAGTVGGLLLYGLGVWLLPHGHAADNRTLAVALVFGVPLILVAIMLSSVMQIGLLGRALPDGKREWLARMGGLILMLALGWLTIFGIAIYGPVIFAFVFQSEWARTGWGRLFGTIVTGGWIGTTLAGLLKANKGPSKPDQGGMNSDLLLKFAPPVFILGLAILLSTGLHATLARFSSTKPPNASTTLASGSVLQEQIRAMGDATSPSEFVSLFSNLMNSVVPQRMNAAWSWAVERHWASANGYLNWNGSRDELLLAFVLALLITLWLGHQLDVNEFSIHLLYRNRLVRAYLGASRQRDPQSFTGFDMNDELHLANLTSAGPYRSRQVREQKKDEGIARLYRWLKLDRRELTHPDKKRVYNGPYPLICTALNLVAGKELAWQKRKATSFIYSPLYCGFDYFSDKDAPPLRNKGYRCTEEYSKPGGPGLGTAVAISGAAAAPNMGYHSSPALTFLMGVFNIRLGWWAGNPRHDDTWRNYGPKWALYLANEIFGRTDDESRYVYLSDGGHFENLGLYELVRRRCKYIILGDADCDENMTFSDLGNAIEKCRRDLGAEITIDLDKLRRSPEKKFSQAHYAFGRIRYADTADSSGTPQNRDGYLMYIKASLTGKEPVDVLAYSSAHPHFPHDSTAEQFFNESQFESYRALGKAAFESVMQNLPGTEGPGFKNALRGGGIGVGGGVAAAPAQEPTTAFFPDTIAGLFAELEKHHFPMQQFDCLPL